MSHFRITDCYLFFPFIDERDAIQKKTFTKWVNKHLKKVSTSQQSFSIAQLIRGRDLGGPFVFIRSPEHRHSCLRRAVTLLTFVRSRRNQYALTRRSFSPKLSVISWWWP
ncbi:hypothetical protein AVEN_227841-1 [Araneus ventricosus]|uniref:Uncharacterized protein n=1 Tax=Araneus ventricosus TaxID=182803 RepID=A0A4Y2RSD8_ARAVE|nr:hypothetical protein AVEN_227841-1 [Araneus ventricosus]